MVGAMALIGLTFPGLAGAAAPNCGGTDLTVDPDGVITEIGRANCRARASPPV